MKRFCPTLDQYLVHASPRPVKKIKLEEEDAITSSTTIVDTEESFAAPAAPLPPILKKIVSGGQTGADRAGLDAALALGIPTGGWAPEGYKTTHGSDFSLRDRYHLQELKPTAVGKGSKTSVSQMYVLRSMKNVDMADGTIAFRLHESIGTDKTIQYGLTGHWGPWNYHGPSKHKPVLVITDLSDGATAENTARIRQFIIQYDIKVVNIAGHRDAPLHVPDFYSRVKSVLQDALKMFK